MLKIEEVRPVTDRLQFGRNGAHDRHDDARFEAIVNGTKRVDPRQRCSSHIKSRHKSNATGLFDAYASVWAFATRCATRAGSSRYENGIRSVRSRSSVT